MDLVMNLCVLLMVLGTINAQQVLYRLRQNFEQMQSPASYLAPSSRVDRHVGGRRQSKNPVRYDDYIDSENDYPDEPSYTVGAQINVGQTSSKHSQKYHSKHQPKYGSNFDPSRATTFTSYQIKHEDDVGHKYAGKIKQKPKKRQYFKPVHEHIDEEESYQQGPQVFPSGTEYSRPTEKYKLRNIPNLYSTEQSKRYRNVASKGQIAKYLEDQQKAFDEEDQFHLANDPTSSSREGYRQFLRATHDDDSDEKDYKYDDDSRTAPETFYGSFKKSKSSKRPQTRKKSPRKTSVITPQSQGLGSFRSSKAKAQTIRFHLDI